MSEQQLLWRNTGGFNSTSVGFDNVYTRCLCRGRVARAVHRKRHSLSALCCPQKATQFICTVLSTESDTVYLHCAVHRKRHSLSALCCAQKATPFIFTVLSTESDTVYLHCAVHRKRHRLSSLCCPQTATQFICTVLRARNVREHSLLTSFLTHDTE